MVAVAVTTTPTGCPARNELAHFDANAWLIGDAPTSGGGHSGETKAISDWLDCGRIKDSRTVSIADLRVKQNYLGTLLTVTRVVYRCNLSRSSRMRGNQ